MVDLGSQVTVMNNLDGKANEVCHVMRVKAMCFLSTLMKVICFLKAQATDYGHKKAMVFPLKLVTGPFIQPPKEIVNPPLVFGL